MPSSMVVVPPKAELEPGFSHWYTKLTTIAKKSGTAITFYGTQSVLKELGDLQGLGSNVVKSSFHPFSNWDDFLILSREVKENDCIK